MLLSEPATNDRKPCSDSGQTDKDVNKREDCEVHDVRFRFN
jgi:hypothetical protein